MTEQEKEIKTIRPRSIILNLSNADVKRISEKAEIAGLTVAELLQSFIGDLVNGTYSNGSDERQRAQEWFERCGYGLYSEFLSFTGFLLENFLFDEFEELETAVEDIKEELNSDYYSPDELESIKLELQETQEEIESICNQYNSMRERNSQEPYTVEQCKADFNRYKEALEDLQEGEH